MMKIKNNLIALVLPTLFICTAEAVEINLLGKLDDVQEHVADGKLRLEGKYAILKMLIDCQFDEQCELNLIPKLEALVKDKNKNNIMYKGFLTYLKWEKSDLEYNIKYCQSDEKRVVRADFADCYEQWRQKEMHHDILSRQEIDKLEHERYMCIKEKMEVLAHHGNIFAQAELVNTFEYLKDPKNMNEWSAKVQSQKGTSQFNLLLKCPELP